MHRKNYYIFSDLYLFVKNNISSIILLAALSIHSFFEGLAIGLIKGKFELMYLLIAIVSHKWAEALFIVRIILKTLGS